MPSRILFFVFSLVFLGLFTVGWVLFVAGWALETVFTNSGSTGGNATLSAPPESKLLSLSNYGYIGHWGIVTIGGFVAIVTFVHILVATIAKRTAFLKIVAVFSIFFHIFFFSFVGYPTHNLGLCLWDDLFANTNITISTFNLADNGIFGDGVACPEPFNLYFMFSGCLICIFFLGITMMITYLTPAVALNHPYMRGELKQ